jgi:disulfide oxidoreductase YuzD
VRYHDVQNPAIREEHGPLIDEMEKRGLLYPVTVIDGVPAYDGAVSYPSILRAVNDKLAQAEPA